MTQPILEKIYAGFLGMNIGIRLGAPVEPTGEKNQDAKFESLVASSQSGKTNALS